MRAGALDRKITIQRKTLTLSDSGDPQEAWATVDLRRSASMWPLRGDERFAAPEITSQEQIEFRIRYSSNVVAMSPLYRVIYPALDDEDETPLGRRIHDIVAVHEIGRREGFRILATRRPDVIEPSIAFDSTEITFDSTELTMDQAA